ncbi:MAG: hypothetical protein RI904_60 [Pseudomonadota bacterium]|jgi:hypothetical protein
MRSFSINARLTRLEAIVPTLATREDLARLDGRLTERMTSLEGKLTTLVHQELKAMSWRLITWNTGVLVASFAGVFFIARHVS